MATTPINVSAAGGSPQRNRELLDNAIALANSSGDLRPIVIPAIPGGFVVDRPVFCFGGNLDLRGANPGTILRGNGGFPPLVLGIHPEPGCYDNTLPPGPRKWSADHWVDAKGKVDGSLAPESGKWFGLRSFNKDGPDTVYGFPHSPFTNPRGKSWSEIPSFTMDLGYEGDPKNPAHIQVCGGSEGAKLRPFYLKTTDAAGVLAHEVDFETTDGVVRWFRFPLGGEKGPRKLSVHIDLPKAIILAWLDGVQVKVDGRGLGEDFKPGNTLRFADAGQSVFKLNGLGHGLDKYQDSFGGPARHTFYWLRLAEGCPYRDDGPDSKQVFADGRVVDDESRAIGHRSPGLLAYLDLATRITDARLVRWVAVRPESSGGYGLALLGQNHCHPYNTATRVRLSDLYCYSGGPETYPWGAGIWCGGTLQGFRFERCSFWGGQDGFGGLMAGACYPVLFRDTTHRGQHGNGLTMHFSTVKFEGQNEVSYPARNGMVFVRSNADISGLFMSEAGKDCVSNVSMLKGGRLTLRDFMFDTENNPAPTVAVVLAERSVSGDFPLTRLDLSNGTIDGGGKGIPLIKLLDATGESGHPAVIDVHGVSSWHPDRGPTIATDGPMWGGRITGPIGTVKDVEASKAAGSHVTKPAWPTRLHVSKWGSAGEISGVAETVEAAPTVDPPSTSRRSR
jgi:hypothetical protein